MTSELSIPFLSLCFWLALDSYHSAFWWEENECTDGSSKSPVAASHWTVLGHMSVPQPVTVAFRMDCSDWLNLAVPALEARSTPLTTGTETEGGGSPKSKFRVLLPKGRGLDIG